MTIFTRIGAMEDYFKPKISTKVHWKIKNLTQCPFSACANQAALCPLALTHGNSIG